MEEKITMNIKEAKELVELLFHAYRFTNGGPAPGLTNELLLAANDLQKKIKENNQKV